MTDKSTQKRKYIIEKAREVFSNKGFKNVTMKDIVDACEISRGGLYLYFSSTSEIFLEVLATEEDDDDDEAIERALRNDATAGDMLAIFLKEQKKMILKKKNNLSIATFEYFTENKVAPNENPIRTQFDTAVMIAERLIENGIRNNEFYCEDPRGCARNLMYVIEGLKVAGSTMGISEEIVDRELIYVLKGLVPDELNN